MPYAAAQDMIQPAMKARNVLSTLLGALLVFNASCACASMAGATGATEAESHAHHHDIADVAPVPDCHKQPDCPDGCEGGYGVAAERDAAKPSSLKLELDHADWAAIGVAPFVPARREKATGPPLEPLPRRASTPVRRFDLQLE